MYFVSSTHRCLPVYVCTTFVFFVRITLVILHSNQRNCQGNARLKPSLPWAGIPCFSVYLLSRRGSSQVAAIPGSLKLIHNNLVAAESLVLLFWGEKSTRAILWLIVTTLGDQSFRFSWNKLLHCTSIFSICCAMEDDNPSCDEVEVSHRQSTAKGYYTRSKTKQAIGEASSNQPTLCTSSGTFLAKILNQFLTSLQRNAKLGLGQNQN